MIKKIIVLSLSGVMLLTTSCASIVSKNKYPLSINSIPSEAKIVITNKKGVEIFSGQTPATVTLKSGSGFFGKASYQVKFEKEGYDSKTVPVEFKLDGWYFGNILIGGLLGMLIIDPATGAMYKLKTEYIQETLLKSDGLSGKTEFKMISIDEIPNEWKNQLVLLEK